MFKKFLVLTALLMSSACASITSGTTQTVAVSTTPKDGASCELANEKGKWTIPSTPGSTTVNKAYGEITIACLHPDGSKGATSIASTTAGSAYGNILVGGIIGAAVDMSSGAAYTYPATAVVALAPGSSTPAGAALVAVSSAVVPVGNGPAVPQGDTVITLAKLSKEDAESQLRDLGDIRKKKLISEEEYQNRVRQILARM